MFTVFFFKSCLSFSFLWFIAVRFEIISSRLKLSRGSVRAQASNVNIGAGGYDGSGEIENTRNPADNTSGKTSSEL